METDAWFGFVYPGCDCGQAGCVHQRVVYHMLPRDFAVLWAEANPSVIVFPEGGA